MKSCGILIHVQSSLSRYNNAQNISYRSYVRRRVFFLLFPDLTEWFRIVAHGEGFPMTSRTGKLCVTTTTYGPSRMRTASACLIKSCKNWSGQKEKSMVAPIKRPCLLWIPKASAMQIPLRKRAMRRENLRNKAAYRSLCHGASSRNLYDNR